MVDPKSLTRLLEVLDLANSSLNHPISIFKSLLLRWRYNTKLLL